MAYSSNPGCPNTRNRAANYNPTPTSKKLPISFTDDTYVNEAEAVIQEYEASELPWRLGILER